jgi:hypothetical protein
LKVLNGFRRFLVVSDSFRVVSEHLRVFPNGSK